MLFIVKLTSINIPQFNAIILESEFIVLHVHPIKFLIWIAQQIPLLQCNTLKLNQKLEFSSMMQMRL